MWRISYEGETQRVPHVSGLALIQRLVASPDRQIDVHDLLGVDRPCGSRQPVLDGPAKAAARKLLEDLTLQLEEARDNNDEGGIHDAQSKLRDLVNSVPEANPGSANRNIADEYDNNRSAAGHAIRKAMRKIADHHGRAHAHLVESLHRPCGSTPCYRPRTPTLWQVNLTATDTRTGKFVAHKA